MVEYVRGYLYKPPSDGYKKLEDADALDLACESLVQDERKPYAHLFTDEDRLRRARDWPLTWRPSTPGGPSGALVSMQRVRNCVRRACRAARTSMLHFVLVHGHRSAGVLG